MNKKFDQVTNTIAQSLTRRVTLKKFGLGLLSVALVCGALSVTGFGPKHYQPGGAWVGGGGGLLWSSLQVPMDPFGQTWAARPIVKHFDAQYAGLLAAFGADNLSDAVGEARMISADTARWTLMAYAQLTPNQPGDLLQTTAIIIYSGTWKYTSDDTAVLNYTINVYPASADADGDGYPDPDTQPVLTIPGIVNTARRVPIL